MKNTKPSKSTIDQPPRADLSGRGECTLQGRLRTAPQVQHNNIIDIKAAE